MELRKYFPGGLSPIMVLNNNIGQIQRKVEDSSDGDWMLEVLMIGLAGYTEAFYKDMFASILNMFPAFATNLKAEITATIDDLLVHNLDLRNSLGFIISEKLNFGSAEDIKKNYSMLLNVKPFTKEDESVYKEIKEKRNLYVHNTGVINKRYLNQHPYLGSGIYQSFLALGKWEVEKYLEFVQKVTKNLIRAIEIKLPERVEEYGYFKGYYEPLINRLLMKDFPELLES